jgi:murein DD-endopeptidase MepM/ murein hydrolase activator NlpD
MTGGFLLAVIAVVLSVIVAAPQYAEPAPEPAAVAVGSPMPSLDPETEAAAPPVAVHEEPTSKPPGKLRGYRWPVRGGMVATYYEPDSRGIVEIEGQPIHDGLVITWFEGAVVKAAHKGTVVAAGRDWATHAGFDGTLDDVYARYAKGNGKKGQKPAFPMGIVVDDGNGYYSVYSELQGLLVKPGDKVTAGQPIGRMSKAEKKQMMRYRLVRMDGRWMKVNEAARKRGYPDYARERIDPLAVLNLDANKAPQLRGKPKDPPRLSEY